MGLKLSQQEVLTLPTLNLKLVIHAELEGVGCICPRGGVPDGPFQTGYSFFTADFCSLVFQNGPGSCLSPSGSLIL